MARIGIFGGTFDPVHRGHLAVARAALRRLKLAKLIFLPAGVPPHKQHKARAAFRHRYAMLKLATAGQPQFVVSRLEALGVHYSIDTVRRIKRSLKKGDRLFFLIGIDAFLEIASWYRAEALLRECEFVVSVRPGSSVRRVTLVLPPSLRRSAGCFPRRSRGGIKVNGVVIHLLRGVRAPVSATQVRAAARRGRPLTKLLPSSVAQYIKRNNLYRA
ncbi:MAG: nicotinate-nucleotide adenylyltransferase [Acidobacteriota bacterium]|nr:nicotinate-nucleotide adenylyltransferase [Acidobacteriota bacterium]